jgi:D-amino-acid dehydrogenase
VKHETSAGNAELPRAVVLGGGIVGSSAAYTLAGDGFDVTLVDSEDQGMATAAGAGIVAPAASLGRPHAWYPLAFAGADFYLRLVARLRGDGISDVGYDAPPLLFLALGDAERERLGEVEEVFRERKAAGAPGLRELTRLEEEEVRGLFPPVA